MPKIISIEEIEDGQVLAEPLTNKFGQTIMPAGASLQKAHQTKFKMWNITSVTIKEELIEGDTEISEDTLAAAKEIFMKRIKWEVNNPYELDLVKIGIQIAAKDLIINKGS
jgi:hypothetical protein